MIDEAEKNSVNEAQPSRSDRVSSPRPALEGYSCCEHEDGLEGHGAFTVFNKGNAACPSVAPAEFREGIIMDKVYLGDSVYAEFDTVISGDVTLTTENGRLDDPSNTIYLEPQVLSLLSQYVERRNNNLGERGQKQ